MGNRGILHNEAKQIVVPWRLRRWIICTLTFKDRHREVFSPRKYTELFFLDEATAFSAGHRPCAECRRDRYVEFREAWFEANPECVSDPRMSIDEVDELIHGERVAPGGGKRTYLAKFGRLPQGTMVECGGGARVIWGGKLWPWSFEGYGEPVANISAAAEVRVLTPQSVVRAFQVGFRPQVHASAPG
jgi:hypothetical protein